MVSNFGPLPTDGSGNEIVKAGQADLADELVEEVFFSDPLDDSTLYTFGRGTLEDEDNVVTDLTVTDTEYGEKSTFRVRTGRLVREAAHKSWEFVEEHKTAAILGGVATGAVVGVMTLFKVRKSRGR